MTTPKQAPYGTGPGAIAPDGSPVELYLALGPGDAARRIASVLPAGCSILELGSGPGLVTAQLRDYGYRVTAVDESSDMLQHVAPPAVRAEIEDLRLPDQFDAVVLASHLLNLVPPPTRRRFLEVCARHLSPGGTLLLELHDSEEFAEAPLERHAPEKTFRIDDVGPAPGGGTTAVLTYVIGDRTWIQRILVWNLDEATLDAELADVGLYRTGIIDHDPTWVTAVAGTF